MTSADRQEETAAEEVPKGAQPKIKPPFPCLLVTGLLLSACDSPKPEEPAISPEERPPSRSESSAPATIPRHVKNGHELDSLMGFQVTGLRSADQAAWLKELFNRRDILEVEKLSYEEGLIRIRYASSETAKDGLIKLLEVNNLTVKEATYLHPYPGNSG